MAKRRKKAKNNKSKQHRSEQHQANTSMDESGQDIPHAENSQPSSLQNENEENFSESTEQSIAVEGEIQDAVHRTEEEEHSDDFFDIENLPEDIFMMILKLLTLNELCRVGRVCKSWYKITRSPVFWRKIRVNIPQSGKIEPISAFMKILPACVISINLNPDITGQWYINFSEFSKELRERCPFLQSLTLYNCLIKVEKEEIVQNCIDLPENIQILALRRSYYFMQRFGDEPENPISNIEVLDLSYSRRTIFSCYSFNRMPKLKELHLAHCDVSDNLFECIGPFINQLHVFDLEYTQIGSKTFNVIQNYGKHLTELYVCWTLVEDSDLIFNEPQNPLPCLKTICLRGCDVTSIGINSLIESCPSLRKVFVGTDVSIPENDYSSCNLEIVKVLNGFIYCHHSDNALYV